MIGERRLRMIEESLDYEGRTLTSDTRDLCAEVRRLVKALADIRKHTRIVARSCYDLSTTGHMLDRALDGYEVDDG